MATLVIPTRTDRARYSIEIDLDQLSFRFDFDWNDRSESWSFNLYDASNVLLLAGRKVVVGFPLLNRFRDPRLPPGDLHAIDTSGANLDPKFADLGDRVKLLYVEAASMGSNFTTEI